MQEQAYLMYPFLHQHRLACKGARAERACGRSSCSSGPSLLIVSPLFRQKRGRGMEHTVPTTTCPLTAILLWEGSEFLWGPIIMGLISAPPNLKLGSKVPLHTNPNSNFSGGSNILNWKSKWWPWTNSVSCYLRICPFSVCSGTFVVPGVIMKLNLVRFSLMSGN